MFYIKNWESFCNSSGPFTKSFFASIINSTTRYEEDVSTAYEFVATYNPCAPWISALAQIRNLEPGWSRCDAIMSGIQDPEIVITPSSGFGPVTNLETHHSKSSVYGDDSAGPSLSRTFAKKMAPPSLITPLPPNESPPLSISTLPAVATIGTMSVTANAESALVIGISTLKPEKKIIYSGTTISMATDGKLLDVDGTTQYLNPSYVIGTQPLVAGTPVIILSGTTYFAPAAANPLGAASVSSVFENISSEPTVQVTGGPNIPSGQQFWMPAYLISSQTLIAGGTEITVSGTTMSLQPDGSSVLMVLATTITEDVNLLFGSSPSTTQTASNGNSSSSSDFETENGTSLNVCPLSTESATTGGKSRSGAPQTQRVKGRQWLCWVVLAVSCTQIAI